MAALEFHILGPLEVRHDGRVLAPPGARQRALLAVLALHAGEVVSSDRLIDAVWGDNPPAAGATALRVRLSQLRRALGPAAERLVTRPPGYVLQLGPDELDLTRFERLVAAADRALRRGAPEEAAAAAEEALGLWRGPPLADVAYEPFAQAPIARLEELRLTATELRVQADLELGRHAALTAELRALTAEHPLRERLWGQLMLALYRDGRQSEALDAFRDARQRLVEEIGLEPGPALRELERRILAQDPALLPAGEPVAAEPAPSRVVVVLADPEPGPVAALAAPLAAGGTAELIVVSLPPEADALDAVWARLRGLGDRAVRLAAFTSEDPGADVTRLAAEQDAALLLLDGSALLDAGGAIAGVAAVPLREASCDVGLVFGADRPVPPGGGVLVPFAGREHDWRAVELGAWLAGAAGLPLQLAGTRGDGAGRRDASRLLSHASLALQRGSGIVPQQRLVAPGTADLLAASAQASVVVAGLSDRWAREGLGTARLALARDAPTPLVLVRAGLRPGGLAPAQALTRFTWSLG